ncbi:hypothetical protein M413DRAFT_410773 [Hebeloma cylindrosporum]|uniref:Uncharacterized protein n=1 Tax=Hebeloma cylindrosporum TaxID=76867 RepID=A0A0C3CAK0_HEBCY|nr:hypothetical protein M413DRAFT_410773 [Hebeloma cylindrosporum h7]
MPVNTRPRRIEGLDQKLCQNNTALIADTLHFESELPIIELANAISDRVPGPHFGLVDPRKHADTTCLIENAHRMYGLFRDQGLKGNDIIINIPATEAGIYATQQLQEDGININLCCVTNLIHAVACAEVKATAISIAVGPLLELYEQKRKTIYPNPSKHPGIETIQSILAYFKLHGIRTKVVGTRFRTLAEIGLLSDCDAVCVSAEHAEKMKWSSVPTTSLDDYGPEHPAVFRARQAKYPMDLLKNAKGTGGFSRWLSPESRNMTCELLDEVLQEMESQMASIEQVVEIEIKRRYEQGTTPLKELYRRLDAERAKSSQSPKVVLVREMWQGLFTPVTSLGVEQAIDEVF